MHWIIGALDVSWTYIGRNLSPMMRYAPALGSHFCQTLSAAVVCPSLDISTELTPYRIITELSRPALRAHLTTGDGGLVVQGNTGSEPWRPTCNLWILDWRLRSDALRIDRLGGNSWQWLRLLRHSPEEEVGDNLMNVLNKHKKHFIMLSLHLAMAHSCQHVKF